MDNELCCYYFGVRKYWQFDFDAPGAARGRGRRRIGAR